ncbi:hypothetical protein BaRGS_00012295 [Batillaria attramentaria]|uniref:Uncharacterized protein n=1 Tax=Batillaria attramentaria TaxID=370345 RepID=A0ABD0LAH3_9CAEN
MEMDATHAWKGRSVKTSVYNHNLKNWRLSLQSVGFIYTCIHTLTVTAVVVIRDHSKDPTNVKKFENTGQLLCLSSIYYQHCPNATSASVCVVAVCLQMALSPLSSLVLI